MKFEVMGYRKAGREISHISEERYKVVKSAKATCIFALEIEEKFALLLDNYYEFETELLKLAEAYRVWPRRDHSNSMLERLKLDQRLVNLLTACRLFSDQTDHGISTMFGNPSGELNSVKSFKNGLYDSHWGYRFMEALRNHVQHSGLPVHIICYNAERTQGSPADYTQFSIAPKTSVNRLAENCSFKKQILSELKSKGKEVDLRPAVREYIECFAKLHEHLREKISTKLAEDRLIYEAAIQAYSVLNDEAVDFPRLVEKNEDETTSDEVALVKEFLDHLDSYYLRNKTNRKLTHSFSANTDQKQR